MNAATTSTPTTTTINPVENLIARLQGLSSNLMSTTPSTTIRPGTTKPGVSVTNLSGPGKGSASI